MKKVVATCIYSETAEGFRCWNFTVNYRGENTTLVQYTPGEPHEPYVYTYFNDLYTSLINILKQNNFCTQVSTEFGRDFYNIQFIELGTTVISKYGHFKV